MFKFLKYLPLLLSLGASAPVSLLHAQEDDLSELEDELEQDGGEKENKVKNDSVEDLDEELMAEEPKKKPSKPTKPDPALEKEAPPKNIAQPAEPTQLKGVDDPDYDLEERVFKIFSELKGPISDSTWKKIVGKRKSESYRIQKGDTLWDISKTLFGDPFYWPKVWAVNEDISNPHFISPGSKLSFYLGTVNDEPAIDIKVPETKDTKIPAPMAGNAIPAEKAQTAEADLLPGEDEDFLPQVGLRAETTEDVIIPATKYKSGPKLKSIPPSLPIWDKSQGMIPKGVTFSGNPPSTPKSVNMPLAAFIAEEFPATVGKIVEFRDQANQGSNYQYVYVEVEGGKVDDTFLVLTKLEKPRKFYKLLDGVPISVDGEIKLVEEIEKDELYKAIIVSNLNPIRKGANLVALKLPLVEVSAIGPMLNVEGKVGGGYLDGQTDIYGLGALVFLDIGTANGIKVGGIVQVLANEKLRNRKTVDDTNKRDIGLIKIVHATENLATGVVVQANDVVMAGDLLGLPGPTNKEILELTAKKKRTASILEDMAKEDLKEQESIKGKPKEKKAKNGEDDEDELNKLGDEDF